MRARVFARRRDAEIAQAALDVAHGVPRQHSEAEYTIKTPGRAAARIRARGVRTAHWVDVESNASGTEFAVIGEAAGSVEIDWETWVNSPRPTATRG